MNLLRAPGRTAKLPNLLASCGVPRRRVRALFRAEGSAAIAPAGPSYAAVELDDLSLAQTSGVLESEPLQTLARLASIKHSRQLLEILSEIAIVLRDAALAAPYGEHTRHGTTTSLQTIFQNGYDTMVDVLQALPQSTSAYSPASAIPETCISLFHVHNHLLQAAYASEQDFEVWTELMQAGLGLYLLQAPRSLVAFTNGQLDLVLDALGHQDLWRFQSLLWQRLLPSIPAWDSMQDFCSVIHDCELQAQEASTALMAATSGFTTPAPNSSSGGSLDSEVLGPPDAGTSWMELLQAEVHTAMDLAGPNEATNTTREHPHSALLSMAQLDSNSSFQQPFLGDSNGSYSHMAASRQHSNTQQQSYTHLRHHDAATGSQSEATYHRPMPTIAHTAASSALYDRQLELAEYSSLMCECIRAAMEGAASRGVAAAQVPHLAAAQLLEVAVAFDARQRCPSAPAALRYAFLPSSEWLNRVAAAGTTTGDRWLSAAQVLKLLSGLESLAPKPQQQTHHSGPVRWLEGTGQAAVERAVVRHLAGRAWTPQQTASVLKALAGRCRGPPSEVLCSAVEGLLLACDDTRGDVGLLCALLQDAVDLTSPGDASVAPSLTPAHMSLVRVSLNRAIYLVGMGSSETVTPCTCEHAEPCGGACGPGHADQTPRVWRDREFLFDLYPRLLHAARRFGYPLQAFELDQYATELYDHLAAAPGHELVTVGPEGLIRALTAVASTPCCGDPQWAAAFERACLTLLSVQFSVGYTHPKRWLGLLETIVATVPLPLPALAAGVKALMVRLCDTRRHAQYFWELLPLVGALERRAAATGSSTAQQQHRLSPSQVLLLQQQGIGLDAAAASLWTSVAAVGATGLGSSTYAAGRQGVGGSKTSRGSLGGHKANTGTRSRGKAGGATVRRGGVVLGSGSSISSSVVAGASDVAGAVRTNELKALRAVVPPPDISRYLVNEEEYGVWCAELGQRLALSMACASDQERVAQLSVLGIGARN